MSGFGERVTAFDEAVDKRLERYRSPALDRVFYSLSSAADHGMLAATRRVITGDHERARLLVALASRLPEEHLAGSCSA